MDNEILVTGMMLRALTDMQMEHILLACNTKKALSQLRMLREEVALLRPQPTVFTRIQSLKFIKARYGK